MSDFYNRAAAAWRDLEAAQLKNPPPIWRGLVPPPITFAELASLQRQLDEDFPSDMMIGTENGARSLSDWRTKTST